jgi:hypothetical protein
LNYLASNTVSTPNLLGKEVSNSVLLAAQYGVSPKTIRDIWNRKTWTHSTADLFERDKLHAVNRFNIQYLDLKVNDMIHSPNHVSYTYGNELYAVSTEQSRTPKRIPGQKAKSKSEKKNCNRCTGHWHRETIQIQR